MLRQPGMSTIKRSNVIRRDPPISLQPLPGKGKNHPIPRCPPISIPQWPGKGNDGPIPRCPPIRIPPGLIKTPPVNVFSPAVIRHNSTIARALPSTIEKADARRLIERPLLPSEQPVQDNGQFYSKTGDRLLEVKLDNGKTAYVDPITNQYFVKEMKTVAGKRTMIESWEGPYSLPKNAQFKGKNFPESQLDGFEVAANTTWKNVR